MATEQLNTAHHFALLSSASEASQDAIFGSLLPENQDRLNTLKGASLFQVPLDSQADLRSQEIVAAFRNGPSDLNDLLNPEIDLHIKSIGNYTIVETALDKSQPGWPSIVTVWAWNPENLKLERCFSQPFERGVDAAAIDAESGILAVLTENAVHIFKVAGDNSSVHVMGHFRPHSLGLRSPVTDIGFTSKGLLKIWSNSESETISLSE